MIFFFFGLSLLTFVDYGALLGESLSTPPPTHVGDCNGELMALFGLLPVEFVGTYVDH